jgi:SAM-dependent methyltransferase
MTPETFARIYPEARAGGFSRYDGTVEFYTRVNALLQPTAVAVDLGAGRGQFFYDDPVPYRRNLQLLKGKCAKVIGLDVSDAVLTNPAMDEAHVITPGARLPLDDAAADFILSDHTFEHIADPVPFEQEIRRVLKPRGWVCARTPNLNGYISIASRLVPEKLHDLVLARAQTFRKKHDVFPTHYLLNSPGQIANVFTPENWDVVCYNSESGPAYFGDNFYVNRVAEFILRRLPLAFAATTFVFAQKRL